MLTPDRYGILTIRIFCFFSSYILFHLFKDGIRSSHPEVMVVPVQVFIYLSSSLEVTGIPVVREIIALHQVSHNGSTARG